MSEPFAPQDLVITLLGAYVRPRARTVWSGGLVVLLGEFGFSDGAARAALTRLVRRGLIERVRDGRLVHYRVTRRADRLLAEGDARIFTLGHTRGRGRTWSVLWHQIPEDRRLQRHRLAGRLRFLGFGSVQDGLWICPHDHSQEVHALLDELDVAEFATLFVGRAVAIPGLPGLVSRAWDLSGLADRYDAFGAEFAPYMGRRAAAKLTDRDAFVTRTRLAHMFRGFPLLDPELPDDLAPLSRSRERAAKIFETLYESLAAPAQRHFDAVAGTDAGSEIAVAD